MTHVLFELDQWRHWRYKYSIALWLSPRLVKVIYYKNVHSFLKNYADLCYFYLLTWFTAALLIVKAIRVESMYEEQDISIFRLKKDSTRMFWKLQRVLPILPVCHVFSTKIRYLFVSFCSRLIFHAKRSKHFSQ